MRNVETRWPCRRIESRSDGSFMRENAGSRMRSTVKTIATALAITAVAASAATTLNQPATASARTASSASTKQTITPDAESPAISPAPAWTKHVSNQGDGGCGSGYVCAWVWDPNWGDYKVYGLYVCHTYALSYWENGGMIRNNQTGGAVTTLYYENYKVFSSISPGHYEYIAAWDPIWYIKSC